MAKELVAADPRYVMPYQYGNPANPGVHESTTAEEIIADCPEVDAFVAGLGTGGTLMGVGRRLKRYRADIRVYAAEPLPGDAVQGLRSLDEGFIPEIFDPSVLDGKFLVSNAESIAALRALTVREGIFAGVSSGGADRGRAAGGRVHGPGHHRGAARGRRLEVPLGGHLGPRPGRRPGRGRAAQPLVSASVAGQCILMQGR